MAEEGSLLVGLAACLVSSLSFGTMFVPVKNYDTKDGVFVQFMMGCAIQCTAVCVHIYLGCPPFYPLAMLGGALWAAGNLTAVPIVNMLGMSVGLLLWSTVGCVVGWATGRFGMFDTAPHIPSNDWLNISGILLSIVSAFMFAMVKSELTAPPPVAVVTTRSLVDGDTTGEDRDALIPPRSDDSDDNNILVLPPARRSHSPSPVTVAPANNLLKLLLGNSNQFCGIALSLVAGILYGLCFMPVIYIQDHPTLYPNAPKSEISYILSHFTGTFLACTSFLVVYCAYTQNRPHIVPQLAAPSFLAGLIFSAGQTAFFVANENLSETISFPIITRVPGVVASLWSVFYFREIKGRRNLWLLSWAMLVAIIGSLLCGLSF